MKTPDALLLRGAIELLHRAIVHVGTNQKVNEWWDGRFTNPAVEAADSILRLASWQVEKEFREANT